MSQVQFVEIANPLGFTNETAALISGLGCTNLTQFKKKDISLDDLQYLTEEDLLLLEVGDTFDFESFEKLQNSLNRKYDKAIKAAGIQDVIKILRSSRKQIEIVNYHLKYVELKLKTNRDDLFIEKDKNQKASEVIIEACDNVLTETKEIRTLLSSYERLKRNEKGENTYFAGRLKRSSMGISKMSSIAGVVGIGLFTMYKLLYR